MMPTVLRMPVVGFWRGNKIQLTPLNSIILKFLFPEIVGCMNNS